MNPTTLHLLAGQRIEPITVADAAVRYLERIRLRGYATNTLKSYAATLTALAEWLAARDVSLLALISERMVDGWLDHLARAGNSTRSQAQKLATLRGLVTYAIREGWIGHDPTTNVRLKFRAARVIAPELDRLLAVIEAIPQRTAVDLRDRAMLRVCLDAALRVSEVAGLDIHAGGMQPQCC
ncbi:MAG TPA: site-specific integrase, partial [Dokdonella sp.]|nr:site-specific integrase [Dokdonella sp.]